MAKSPSISKVDEDDVVGVLTLSDVAGLDSLSTARPLAPLTRVLQLFLTMASLSWFAVVVSRVALSLTSQASDGWPDVSDRAQLAGSLALASSAIVGVLVIAWTTMAYRNLDAAGLASEPPNQVLLSWFIPAVNLSVPAKAIEELYLASGARHSTDRRLKPLLVWFWWLAGPIMLLARFVLLQTRPMVFPGGWLARVFDLTEWGADAAIALSCLTGIVVTNRILNAEDF